MIATRTWPARRCPRSDAWSAAPARSHGDADISRRELRGNLFACSAAPLRGVERPREAIPARAEGGGRARVALALYAPLRPLKGITVGARPAGPAPALARPAPRRQEGVINFCLDTAGAPPSGSRSWVISCAPGWPIWSADGLLAVPWASWLVCLVAVGVAQLPPARKGDRRGREMHAIWTPCSCRPRRRGLWLLRIPPAVTELTPGAARVAQRTSNLTLFEHRNRPDVLISGFDRFGRLGRTLAECTRVHLTER